MRNFCLFKCTWLCFYHFKYFILNFQKINDLREHLLVRTIFILWCLQHFCFIILKEKNYLQHSSITNYFENLSFLNREMVQTFQFFWTLVMNLMVAIVVLGLMRQYLGAKLEWMPHQSRYVSLCIYFYANDSTLHYSIFWKAFHSTKLNTFSQFLDLY